MKTGGRKSGTPNKKTIAVQEQMEQLGFDPIESMIEISNQAMVDKNYALAGQMAKELAQYVYPKRKAVEHITDPAEWPKITINITNDPKPLPNSSAAKLL